jgi:heat shock protein HtpX
MWEQIRANRIRSAVLTVAMCFLLLAVGYVIGLYFLDSPTAGLILALIVWAFMSLLAYFQGDSIFLALSGARKISRDDYPRLYNIVEEMKIASGLEKMPDIYIIDDPAMNAFATGRDPNRAAVAVTSGLLQKLNRDELQGVIGHEIAHIKNRDVLLMAMAGVLLGAIVILAWYASRAMIFGGVGGGRRSSRSGGGQGAAIIAIIGLVLMILAPIAAQLIYFAISRKREYLADASSALYTRYPEGLASALEKIANSSARVRTANQATAPMYTVSPFQKKGLSAENLASTHPPIAERVRILRAMAGASLMDYERAYERTTGKRILSAASLSAFGVAAVPVREARPEPALDEKVAKVERTRETSDLMWHLSNYKVINCDCGARIKVPPAYRGTQVRCPHCGKIHQV